MKQKMTFGPWFKVVFRGLYAARRLRGTPFDPFGWAKVRRVERGLVAEYRGLVQQLCQAMTAENHERAVALACAPDLVRGYEEIKLASVERYRARLAELAPSSGATAVESP
jgi:indolepyruvate ferredoxin oxidoreductase